MRHIGSDMSGRGEPTQIKVQLRLRLARAGAALLRIRRLVRAPIWLYRARLGAILEQTLGARIEESATELPIVALRCAS